MSDEDRDRAADFIRQSAGLDRDGDGLDDTLGALAKPVRRMLALAAHYQSLSGQRPENVNANAAAEVARFIVDAHRKARGESA